jgi:hypothetical protein
LNLKHQTFLPDIVLRIFGLVPAYVFHNLAKARMLRLVFWHLALDKVPGAYVEFGVASGNSMRSAEIAEKKSSTKSLGVEKIERNLYGFDTFEGFASSFEGDQHEVWTGVNFSVDFERVKNRFKRSRNQIKLFKVDACKLGENYVGEQISDYVLDESIAIVLFDMDLSEPTHHALEFVKKKLVLGSILIFDEYNGFKSDENLGEYRALKKFLDENDNFKLRLLMRYGMGAAVFQIASL